MTRWSLLLGLTETEGDNTGFIAPVVGGPTAVHGVLQVQDDGAPALAAFRRAVVTVVP